MQTQEPSGGTVLDLLSLLAAVADDVVVATARDTHAAVAQRAHGTVRRGVGPAGLPPELLHRGIAAGVYAVVGGSLRATSVGLDALAATGRGARLDAGPRTRFVTAAVNGLIGDELLRDRPQLAIPMAVRRDGRDVVLPEGVGAAFPAATGLLVVFLHGLCETEASWDLHRSRTGTTYGEALAGRGWTPIHLRANTGLAVRENGAALAALLQRLVDAWPVPVRRIALVGHSMGGLIMRAATAVATERADPWADHVTDLITLGTPHLGAPLARGAGWGSRMLARTPETAPYARILERRAAGIRDLVDGLADEPAPSRAGKQINYRLVAATLTRSARNPLGALAGDLLVRPRSAVGADRTGRRLFPDAELLHVGRTDHFGLLNHPQVLTALERWLCSDAT